MTNLKMMEGTKMEKERLHPSQDAFWTLRKRELHLREQQQKEGRARKRDKGEMKLR